MSPRSAGLPAVIFVAVLLRLQPAAYAPLPIPTGEDRDRLSVLGNRCQVRFPFLRERPKPPHSAHFIYREHTGLQELYLYLQFGLLVARAQIVEDKFKLSPANAFVEKIARDVLCD